MHQHFKTGTRFSCITPLSCTLSRTQPALRRTRIEKSSERQLDPAPMNRKSPVKLAPKSVYRVAQQEPLFNASRAKGAVYKVCQKPASAPLYRSARVQTTAPQFNEGEMCRRKKTLVKHAYTHVKLKRNFFKKRPLSIDCSRRGG